MVVEMAFQNKALKTYNLNVNVAAHNMAPGALLGIEGPCLTPRTPEIVNSLIAMGNPFDSLGKTGQENTSPNSEDSRSDAASPTESASLSPPSVQHTCSQLIKEGLKLTLQSKRKLSGSDSKDEIDEYFSKRSKTDELTTEDEERRKRRRERNKIAATKCRMKKRERTANLATESEVLETQNVDLKSQIKDLEVERRNLEDWLSKHACMRTNIHGALAQTAAPTAEPSEPFPQSFEPFLDPDFGDTSALLSYNKDPNLGKLMDSFWSQGKTIRSKSEGVLRGGFHCEEEDPDVYRPNGGMDNFYTSTDSGYNSFNAGSLDHGCRA